MASTSDNGWTLDPALWTSTVGADSCSVRAGDAGHLLDWFAQQFHDRVEPVVTYNGYRSTAFNKQIGGYARSNHVSATAIDINGARHPYEFHNPKGWIDGFTAAQRKEIRKILAEADGVIKWGVDFAKGYRDAMHFEIIGNASQVSKVWGRLKPLPPDAPITFPEDGMKIRTRTTTKTQAIPYRKWTTIRVKDTNTSLVTGPGAFDAQVQIHLTGVTPGREVQVRFIEVQPGSGGAKTKVTKTFLLSEFVGTGGGTYGSVSQKGTLVSGRRLRAQIKVFDEGVKIARVDSTVQYWR